MEKVLLTVNKDARVRGKVSDKYRNVLEKYRLSIEKYRLSTNLQEKSKGEGGRTQNKFHPINGPPKGEAPKEISRECVSKSTK